MRAVDPTGPFPFAPRGCGRYGNHLDLYAEGELRDGALLRAVRAHLEACAACRDYLQDHDALTREILATDEAVPSPLIPPRGTEDARWMGPFRAGLPPLRGTGFGRGVGLDPEDAEEFPRWGDTAAARGRLGRVLTAVESLPGHDPEARARVEELEIARLLRARPTAVRGHRSRPGRRLVAAAALLFAAGLAFAVLVPTPRSAGIPAILPRTLGGDSSDLVAERGAVLAPAVATASASARPVPLRWKFARSAEASSPQPRAPGSPLLLVGFRPAVEPRDQDQVASDLAAVPAGAIEWVVEATLADWRGMEDHRLFLVSEAGMGTVDASAIEWVEIAPRALRAGGAATTGTAGLSTSGETYRAFVVRGATRWTAPLWILPPGSHSAATGGGTEAGPDAHVEALLRGERRGKDAWQEWVTPASWRP